MWLELDQSEQSVLVGYVASRSAALNGLFSAEAVLGLAIVSHRSSTQNGEI